MITVTRGARVYTAVVDCGRAKPKDKRDRNHRSGREAQRLGRKFWNGETISPSNPRRPCGNWLIRSWKLRGI